jgi:hypothetical protein
MIAFISRPWRYSQETVLVARNLPQALCEIDQKYRLLNGILATLFDLKLVGEFINAEHASNTANCR